MITFRIIILPRLFRVVGLIRTIRIIRHRDHLKTGSRHLVGQNKKRTIGNGFDLDLCVISGKSFSMFDLIRSFSIRTTMKETRNGHAPI